MSGKSIKPTPDEHRVERGSVVTLRGEIEIADGAGAGREAHLLEKEPAHEVERAEGGSDVARPRPRDHVERC